MRYMAGLATDTWHPNISLQPEYIVSYATYLPTTLPMSKPTYVFDQDGRGDEY